MKKMLLGALLIAGTALFAQDVPASVKKSFQTKFPKAQEAEWSEGDGSFDVDFYEGSVGKIARFDEAGKWIETRTVVENTPPAIEKAVSTKHKGASVDGVTLVESSDGNSIYEVNASSESASYTITADKTGKILSSEESANESYDSDDE